MCVNMKLKQLLFHILRSEEGIILKLNQLIKYKIRNIFTEKNMKNMCSRSLSQTSFKFWHITQNSWCTQETLLKISYSERWLSKSLKKLYFYFRSRVILWARLWKTKVAWNQLPVALQFAKLFQGNLFFMDLSPNKFLML